jgi:hypothetical protein
LLSNFIASEGWGGAKLVLGEGDDDDDGPVHQNSLAAHHHDELPKRLKWVRTAPPIARFRPAHLEFEVCKSPHQ